MLSLGTALAFLAAPFMFKPAEAEEKPKVDPYSIRGLIAWLETQDPATRYSYGNAENCLWEHYARSIGHKAGMYAQDALFNAWNAKHGTYYSVMTLPGRFGGPNIGNWCSRDDLGGETYGAALKRARLHVK